MNKAKVAWSGPLGDALAVLIDHRGKTPKKLGGDWTDEGVPVFSALHIKNGRLEGDDARRISWDMYERWMPVKLQEGDVLLTSEAPLGEVAYLASSRPACLGQRLFGLRPHPEVLDARYLYYWLQHPIGRSQLLGRASGTTVSGIRQAELVKVQLDLPAVSVQHRIAAVLAAYDELIENNLRRIEILEEMAQTVYREWFVHFRFPGHEDVALVDSPLGPIPEGWTVEKLGDRVELAYGKALKAETRKPGPVPVLGSSGIVGWHDEPLVDGPGIVVGRKGNVGSVHRVDSDFHPIDTTFYVVSELSLQYLFLNLRNQHFLNSDAAVPGLNRNQAYSNPLVVPPPPLLDEFDKSVEPMSRLARNLQTQNINLRATRDLLLPKLVSGEIDVSDLDIDTEWLAS